MKRLDTFFLLCNCLDAGGGTEAHDAALRRRLSSGRADWESLVRLASHHLLCPALYWALSTRNLMSCIPAELRLYLSTLYDLNGERNRQATVCVLEIVRLLNDIGVEPVLLKGSALLFSDLYRDPNIRFLSDIDLLIPGDRLMDCVKRLQASGYHPVTDPQGSPEHHHYPRMVRRGEYVGVELHHDMVPKKYVDFLDSRNVIRNALSLSTGEAGARIPSPQHLMIHNVVHTMIVNEQYHQGQISLRDLYDFILIRDALGAGIDWMSIASLFERNGGLSALSGYLLAAQRFFGRKVPDAVRVTGMARCYFGFLVAQIKRSWVMRIACAAWLAFQLHKRLLALIVTRRAPKVWSPDWYRRNCRWAMETLDRYW